MNSASLSSFFLKHRFSYLCGILLLFAATFMQTYIPSVLGSIIDIIREPNFQKRSVLNMTLQMVALSLGSFALTFLWRMLIIGNARQMEKHLRETLYKTLQSQSQDFYDSHKSGDLIACAINDISAVRMAFGPATAMSVHSTVICGASIWFMITRVHPQLTLLSLIPVPPIIFAMYRISRMIRVRFFSVQKTFADLTDHVQETIGGIRVIKSFVREAHEIERFQLLNTKMETARNELVSASALLTPVIEVCFSISFFLNLIIGGNLVLNGAISLGEFVAFNTYLAMIMAPIVTAGRIISNFQKGLVSYTRLESIFSSVPSVRDTPQACDVRLTGTIYLDNLGFTYPGGEHLALNGITTHIPQGHCIGITGKTGSGKSTLAQLLCRQYDSYTGTIHIDSHNIKDIRLETLRSNIVLVPQDTFIFSTRIRDNISFFSDSFTHEQIIQAAQIAGIHDFIASLPAGYDTVLGERGINISGGQKQRIAIARALVREPSVLILDDALSAVDAHTEAGILTRIAQNRTGKTTLIISHRIQAISRADTIYVLDKGTIAEQGTHAELLLRNGLYKLIAEEQMREHHE